jgi:hypothetical protein
VRHVLERYSGLPELDAQEQEVTEVARETVACASTTSTD